MKNNEEFVRLEQLVDALISNCKEQKEKIKALEKKLKEREEECELLKLDLAEQEKQRTEVSARVAGLVDRIAQWEAGMQKKEGKGI